MMKTNNFFDIGIPIKALEKSLKKLIITCEKVFDTSMANIDTNSAQIQAKKRHQKKCIDIGNNQDAELKVHNYFQQKSKEKQLASKRITEIEKTYSLSCPENEIENV